MYKVLIDNTSYSKEELNDLSNLLKEIENKPIDKIPNLLVYPETIKYANDLSDEQIIIESNEKKYFTKNLVGFIGYKNEHAAIRSRFGDNLFKYLFQEVYDIPNIVKYEGTFTFDNIYEYLVFLFPGYLKEAMRKGPFKKYVWEKHNDKNIRGYIDISRHIKINAPFVGKVAYNTREFSYDNFLMQLLRHTIEYIKKKEYGRYILTKSENEVKVVKELTPSYSLYNRQKVIFLNKKHEIRHSYFKEYSKLQEVCIQILTHKMIDYKESKNRVYGILFDCASLWEEYIYKLINDEFYHPNNRTGELKQNFFNGYKKDGERKKGLIYPDFISKNSKNGIIADAKYKPLDNISGKDYMQILSYMFRFDSKTGYFFYPQKEGDSDTNGEILELLQGINTDKEKETKRLEKITIEKLGLLIDRNEDFNKFFNQMKINENKLKDYIKNNA